MRRRQVFFTAVSVADALSLHFSNIVWWWEIRTFGVMNKGNGQNPETEHTLALLSFHFISQLFQDCERNTLCLRPGRAAVNQDWNYWSTCLLANSCYPQHTMILGTGYHGDTDKPSFLGRMQQPVSGEIIFSHTVKKNKAQSTATTAKKYKRK